MSNWEGWHIKMQDQLCLRQDFVHQGEQPSYVNQSADMRYEIVRSSSLRLCVEVTPTELRAMTQRDGTSINSLRQLTRLLVINFFLEERREFDYKGSSLQWWRHKVEGEKWHYLIFHTNLLHFLEK